jgi:alpha-methylacyl-CoA racemase
MADGSGPLGGIRVVEIAALGAAPYGVMLLADLGADVVRIDRPGAATDPSALAQAGVGRGRRSLQVDLKHARAHEVVDALLADADVLVEGFRPGVMERLSLGPDVVCARHPHLVYARMTGFGQDGPLAARAGHDLNYAALAGALHPVGPAHLPPPPPLNYLADLGGGGTFLALGVTAALLERARSGRGQVLDVAMIDGAASLTAFVRGLAGLGAWSGGRGGNLLDGGAPFYATYTCADGRFVAVGAIEPQFYAALLAGLGLAAAAWPQHDRARWPALAVALQDRFATASRDDWEQHFAGVDACVTPVLDLAEVAQHPHHVARTTFSPIAGHVLPMPTPAPRFSRTPGPVGRAAGRPGADLYEVLGQVGIEADAVADLIASGVVVPADLAGRDEPFRKP